MREKPLSDDEIRDQMAAIDNWRRKKRSRWLKRQNIIHKIKKLMGGDNYGHI